MTLDILVVEDKEHHLEDVKSMLDKRIVVGVELNIKYAKTLIDAYEKVRDVDGVLSDVFFPYEEGENIEPCGYNLVYRVTSLKKYVVVCTDGWHHGPHLEKIDWSLPESQQRFYLGMVDRVEKNNNSMTEIIEYNQKNWPRAYFTLMKRICPEEADAFRSVLENLGVDAEAMLESYWGPKTEDLNKVYEKANTSGL